MRPKQHLVFHDAASSSTLTMHLQHCFLYVIVSLLSDAASASHHLHDAALASSLGNAASALLHVSSFFSPSFSDAMSSLYSFKRGFIVLSSL